MDNDDWEQQVLFGEQSIPVPQIAAIRHGHVSFQQVKSYLPAKLWSSYFKFGFVRNPFDRFVSICFFLNRRNPGFAGNAVEYMQRAIKAARFRQRILVKPQYQLLADNNNRIMMDYVGRYESLQTSFDEICRQIGIASSQLPRKNSSRHESWEHYYNAALKEAVAGYYREDFKLLGYDAREVVVNPSMNREYDPREYPPDAP